MTVFNDFLTFVIHGFSPGAPPLKNWKYKRRQNIAFMEMTAEWVRLMQDRLKDDESWYDPFGDLYMSLSSRTGQRMQGQFFTPRRSVTSWSHVPGPERKYRERG